MEKSILQPKIAQLPNNPGVYFFYGSKGALLYIGKATNLRSRVSSYFRGEHNRGQWISKMISLVEDISVQETDSVLEALILESNLIKKHQPKYNTDEKDDKSFAYFVITKEEYPRVLIVRKTDLDKADANLRMYSNQRIKTKKIQNTKYDIQYTHVFGPYTSKYQMQVALKIIRRIFPFHALKQKSEKGCLDFQLGMCPGPYDGAITKEDYKKNIRGIRMILEGKKKSLVKTLEKEMQAAAKAQDFEKAAELRNRIFALQHIRDIALMTREFGDKSSVIGNQSSNAMRVEAYDISNIGGQNSVGSMVVFKNGKPNKSQYRKFKIKTIVGSDDVGSMREVLLRRFKNDWPMPELVLLDGGAGHLNMAEKLLHEELGLAVNIVAVAKGPTRKKLDIRISMHNTRYKIQDTSVKDSENNNNDTNEILQNELLIKLIMDEAHRFAITFHRKLRRKNALK
jgi:excinuclease ABC subunit C